MRFKKFESLVFKESFFPYLKINIKKLKETLIFSNNSNTKKLKTQKQRFHWIQLLG